MSPPTTSVRSLIDLRPIPDKWPSPEWGSGGIVLVDDYLLPAVADSRPFDYYVDF